MSGEGRASIQVAHAPWRSRLEARIEDRVVGVLEYAVRGTWAVLAHTEITEDRRSGLINEHLVDGALDLLRSRGYRILAVCPWVQAFLRDHPEHVDGIDEFPVGLELPMQRTAEGLPVF